jgi:hypothetical protein
LNSIKENCWKTGKDCSPGKCHTKLRRFDKYGLEKIMEHPIYRVIQFEILAPYTLRVIFNDGKEQVIDFEPVLAGELFRPLYDERLFNQVEIDPEIHILVWPNGADFDPATLHDWPQYVKGMKALAKQWANKEIEVG